MRHFLSIMTWLFVAVLGDVTFSPADDSKKATRPSATDLSLQIAALQTLYTLDLNRVQMGQILVIARQTTQKSQPREEVKASNDFLRAMTEYHNALVKAADEDRIGKLAERYDSLKEKEKIDLNDDIELTEEAVDKAPEVFLLLSARQVATYVGNVAQDIPDPRERLNEAIANVRGITEDKWPDYREEISDEVSQVLAGLDADKSERIKNQVVQLLIVVRSLKDKEFKSQKADLEKRVQRILEDTSPTEVLRNVMEQALAELLSNPQLPPALEARLK